MMVNLRSLLFHVLSCVTALSGVWPSVGALAALSGDRVPVLCEEADGDGKGALRESVFLGEPGA
jgi:hypothetical protein